MSTPTLSINIARGQLAALLLHAPKKDVRFYLNGVNFAPVGAAGAHCVATNGATLFAGFLSAEITDGGVAGIIPRDALEVAAKGRADHVVTVRLIKRAELTRPVYEIETDAGKATGDCVDGRFPDWLRVVPTVKAPSLGTYDASLLLLAGQSIALWMGKAKTKGGMQTGNLIQAGMGSAAVLETDNAIALVMPMSGDRKPAAPFSPPPWLHGDGQANLEVAA